MIKIVFCKIDNDGFFVSSREGDEFSTWDKNELRGVTPPLIVKEGRFYKWDGIWQELSVKPVNKTEWKASRTTAVANIKVTVDAMEFDGDEISQTRMTRAIVAINDTDTMPWVLADNTQAFVTKTQLTQALKLAGEEQTRLWVYKEEQ